MRVQHAEMDSIVTYCKKMYTYGRSRQLHRHIMKTRPLSLSERLQVLRACLSGGQYSLLEVVSLLGGLTLGMVSWTVGAQTCRWRRPQ
jgi:hypothetical protein